MKGNRGCLYLTEFSKYVHVGHVLAVCPYRLIYRKQTGWVFINDPKSQVLAKCLNICSCVTNIWVTATLCYQVVYHISNPSLLALDAAVILPYLQCLYSQWFAFRDPNYLLQILNEHIKFIPRARKAGIHRDTSISEKAGAGVWLVS